MPRLSGYRARARRYRYAWPEEISGSTLRRRARPRNVGANGALARTTPRRPTRTDKALSILGSRKNRKTTAQPRGTSGISNGAFPPFDRRPTTITPRRPLETAVNLKISTSAADEGGFFEGSSGGALGKRLCSFGTREGRGARGAGRPPSVANVRAKLARTARVRAKLRRTRRAGPLRAGGADGSDCFAPRARPVPSSHSPPHGTTPSDLASEHR